MKILRPMFKERLPKANAGPGSFYIVVRKTFFIDIVLQVI
jgi:hypothetical protein